MAVITTLNSGDALEPTSRNNINNNFTNLNTDKIEASGVTYANLNANGDVGTGATQVSQGDHSHAHGSLTGIGTDDHHAEAHTIASHSDTTATGTELETLTDGSNADALHTHAFGGWTELGESVLGSAAGTITVSSIAANKDLAFILVCNTTSISNDQFRMTFNNDTGANYGMRASLNGGADNTGAAAAHIDLHGGIGGNANGRFIQGHISNPSSFEKFVQFETVTNANGTGAPDRITGVGIWNNTAQVSEIDITLQSGTFPTGTRLTVYGRD